MALAEPIYVLDVTEEPSRQRAVVQSGHRLVCGWLKISRYVDALVRHQKSLSDLIVWTVRWRFWQRATPGSQRDGYVQDVSWSFAHSFGLRSGQPVFRLV